MWHLSGVLDPEGGAVLSTALTALRHTDHSSGDLRTATQRDADALTALARGALDHGDLPRSYQARPHLLITLRSWRSGSIGPIRVSPATCGCIGSGRTANHALPARAATTP